MIRFFLLSLAFLTQGAWAFMPPPGGGQGGGGDLFQVLIMITVFMGIFYFIVIRPQHIEQRKHQERINNLQKGDRVVTSGGIHGVVRATKEKTLVLEVAEGVKVTLNRSAVATVLEGPAPKSRPGGDEDEEE